ncbi:MAG: HYR domain-containing protein, partial [Flavobacteriaceae bacterium]|nr:HYR domain-containing protein [Flavobacteriaceae bacterium]
MKKITLTLLAFVVTCCMWQTNAQNYTSLTEAAAAGVVPNNTTRSVSNNSVIIQTQGRAVSTTYSDRPTFQAAAGPGMILEDFAGGPAGAGIFTCGETVSSAGGGCFPANEIVGGLEITNNTGNTPAIIALGPGTFGNADFTVGTNFFADATVINFTNGDANAFGADLYNFTGTGAVDVRIYGTGGLIATYSVPGVNPTGPTFFGAIADEVITSVELEVPGGGIVEHLANIEFGRANSMTCGLAPLPIPAVGTQGAMDPSPATVGLNGTVGTDYSIESVTLDLNHTFDGDLDISLTSPDGTVHQLSNDNGGAGNNYTGTVFMDGFPSINGQSAPFTGTFEPEGGPMNPAFDGDNLTGDWVLNIFDNFGGDSGNLIDWCINFAPILGSPPVIMCPANIVSDNDPGQCGAVQNYVAVAIDPDGNLDTVEQISPDPLVLGTGDEFPIGTTTVTFRATDTFGNFSECSFDITVNDVEDPTVTCQDLTVELDANGDVTVLPGDVVTSFSDNCPGTTLEFIGPGSPFSLTTSFADNNGSAGNMFDVMPLNDIIVNSFDVNNSSGGTVDYEIYYKTGSYIGSETNAGDWMLVGSALGVPGNGSGNATPLDLTMGLNLAAGTMHSFYVADIGPGTHNYINGATEGALWASDANLEVYEGVGKGGLFGSTFRPRNFSGNVVYETAGTLVASLDFGCADVGDNVVTVVATDASGNTATCQSTITVEDNIAPVIVCIGEQLTGPNTVSDSPGIPIVDNTTFTTTIDITDDFTINDLNMAVDIEHTWTGDITLTLESPAGTQVIVFDDADGCSGDNIMDTYDDESVNPLDCQAGTSDAFPLDDYIPSNPLSAFDGESTLGTWILSVEDDAGGDTGVLNSWAIIYDFDPIVAAPLEVDLDAMGMATLNASDLLISVDEACGWTATVAGAPAPVSLETTFAGGNGQSGNMFDINALNDVTISSFDVSMDDGTTDDVEIYFKTGTWVGFEADPSAWTLIETAAGITSAGDNTPTPLNLNLDVDVLSGETVAFYVTLVNTTNITYTNGTGVGNVFASDANIEFLEGSGNAYPFGATFAPRVFNGNIIYTAGGGMSTTIDFTCADLGENLIEVTVTDDSGNVSTCTATVNVNDVTPPVLVCDDVTIGVGPTGVTEIDPMALLANSPSTYQVVTISSDNQSGAPGETDLTVPVTVAGDVSFDWDYTTPDGPAFDSFGYLLNGVFTELTDPGGANDQSGNSGLISLAPGDVFGFRSSSVDGLFGAATTTISNFVPGFNGQFDPANWTVTLNNSDGDAFFVEIPGGPLSFDACGITILAVDITEVTCDDVGTTITITVFASDSSLNIAVCQSMVTVVDDLAPEVTCPEDQTVDPGVGNLFWEVEDYWDLGLATATDNCTDPLVDFSQDPAPGTLLSDGVYTVTLCSTDEYGNEGCCTFELTVESILG